MNEQTIGKNIRRLRLAQNITQSQLAQTLGVAYQTVSKWETEATLPDTMLLPEIAAFFGVSIDELFRGRQSRCAEAAPAAVPKPEGIDKDFLLKTYSQMYDPEAGPWNLSVENKYLEYRFAQFFRDHFPVKQGAALCNIGIGAGAWDRFLSYQLRDGCLTSIDIDPLCCRQLREGLDLERNPGKVDVICADVLTLEFQDRFDIVTMVGSTVTESGLGLRMLEQAMGFVKPGGRFFYQSIAPEETMDQLVRLAHRAGLSVTHYETETVDDLRCVYWCLTKA